MRARQASAEPRPFPMSSLKVCLEAVVLQPVSKTVGEATGVSPREAEGEHGLH